VSGATDSTFPQDRGVIAASPRMPPKIGELIAELRRAGFIDRGGKGSHRNFVHPNVRKPVTISGSPSDDAKPYQIRAVRAAIQETAK